MKKYSMVAVSMLVVSISVFANTAKQAPSAETSLSSTPQGFFLGFGAYNYHYEESTDKTFFMSNKGSMQGVLLSYTSTLPWKNISWTLRMESATGDLDYASDGTGELSGAQNNMGSTSVLFRHDLPVTSTMTLSPYYGLGYRVLEDNKQNMTTSTGHSGYHRRSEYFYFPLGLKAQMSVSKNVRLMPRMQWNAFYHGRQISDFDMINNQYIGYGYTLGLTTSTAVGRGAIEVDLRYKRWHIDDSSLTTYPENNGSILVKEPENTTSEFGLNLGYRF